jgi:hypothetical protein
MDCCVRVYFGRIVRKEDGEFEDMEEELEWFDEPPSFSDLCLQDYAVYHHRPYFVTHSDKNLGYHITCKAGFPCQWKLTARKKASDGKWMISKLVQPHLCLDNKGKEYHPQLTVRYLAHRILGLVDKDNDVSVSYLQQSIFELVKYHVKNGKAWRAKQIALAIRWGSWEEAYNRAPRILSA